MKNTNGRQIRVFILDEHPVARRGTEAYLSAHDGIRIVGRAASLEDVIDARQPSDVVVLDVQPIPHVTRKLRENLPRTNVVVFTGEVDEGSIRQAVRGGANGYLLKTALAEELILAIETVHSGETYYSKRGVSSALLHPSLSDSSSKPSLSLLTPREVEVLKGVAEGSTNKEIAERLQVSFRTIESHRERIMQKLDIHTAAGLTRFAIANGVIDAW